MNYGVAFWRDLYGSRQSLEIPPCPMSPTAGPCSERRREYSIAITLLNRCGFVGQVHFNSDGDILFFREIEVPF